MSRAFVLVLLAFLSAADSPSVPIGEIAGRVRLAEATAPRRTANRYSGAASAAHAIQNVPAVVYLVGVERADSGPRRAIMSQQDTAFAPSAVVVQRGGSVSFPNEDPFFHNVFSYSSAQRFDLGRYPQGESKQVTFPEPGIVEVFCEVHEFMRGAIVVTDNPFYAVVDSDGDFRISGVPEGEHRVVVWHPDYEPLEQRVIVSSGGTARVEVELRR